MSYMKTILFSGSDLPQELEEQILLKLPVKSLLRFRSVCKSWNSRITDPEFVNDHLQANTHKSNSDFSNNKPSSMVFAFVSRDPPVVFDDYGNDFELDQKQMLSLVTDTTVENICLPLRPKVLGDGCGHLMPLHVSHCNGIICLVDFSPFFINRVVFYNPALREHKFLQTLGYRDYTYPRQCYGFGHDPKTDDYKFISILEEFVHAEPNRAEVYSLRTGVWRKIKLEWACKLSSSGAYVKGRYYWINITETNITSFDMSDESFGSVELPRRVVSVKGWSPRVIAWGDSLAYVATYHTAMSTPTLCYDMWVMDRRDGGWAQYFKIGPLVSPTFPLASWKGDEVLMEDPDGCVLSYNLHTKEQRKIPFSVPVKYRTIHCCFYVESLVSVNLITNNLMCKETLDLDLHLGTLVL